jgi:hypothetical protein
MIDAQSETGAMIREFWRLMATNDFHSVKAVLAPDLAAAANRSHLVERMK